MSTLTIRAILNRLIAELGMSEAELARQIKIPLPTLNKITTGRVLDPKASTLIRIANYFNVTVDQLLGNAPLQTKNSCHLHYVPLIEWHEIENMQLEQLDYTNHKNWISFENQYPIKVKNIFALKVVGDAMSPCFDESTIVVIAQGSSVANKKCALIYLAEKKEFVLRQVFLDGKSMIAKPVNGIFNTMTVNEHDKVIGGVIHSIRSF